MTNTPTVDEKISPSAEDLWFLPLGGAGEIGMNLNLYGHAGKWLMVDLGVTFNNKLGIEVLMPDPQFIVERKKDLVGLVLTHGHEDHIGAVPYLWPKLRCPIYATPFTAELVRRKLKEAGLGGEAQIIEIPLRGTIDIAPFSLTFVSLTHSIPEPNAIVLKTPVGTVFHTGDWKLDPEPVIGEKVDEKALRDLGQQGILAMVCDSTNVFYEGEAGSEAALYEGLSEIVGQCKRRVVVTCFASNVARLKTIATVAAEHKRAVIGIGRSIVRMEEISKEMGYLSEVPAFLKPREAKHLPPEETLIVCTGSQGEARAALMRIALNQHPDISLEFGDMVIFSSRVIPGNEEEISNLQNLLIQRGVEVITSDDGFIHVSGHPYRNELKEMYQWIKPRIVIPVHGEMRHLIEHQALALTSGVPYALAAANGRLISLSDEGPKVLETVKSGRLGVDGNKLIHLTAPHLYERSLLSYHGAVFVTLMVDRNGERVSIPQLTFLGLGHEGAGSSPIAELIEEAIDEALEETLEVSSEALKEAIRLSIRRVLKRQFEHKPLVEVHLIRK